MKKRLFAAIILCTTAVMLSSCTIFGKTWNIGNFYSDADKYSVGDFACDGDEVRKINIDWTAGEITLLHGEDVLAAEKDGAGLDDDQRIHTWLDGDELKIKFCKSGYMGSIDAEKKNLTLTMPEGVELELSTVSSAITADNLNLAEADISTTSGSFSANSVTTNSFDFESISGDAEIESLTLTEDFDFDTTSGSVKINTLEAREADFNSTGGDMEVQKINLSGTLSCSTTSGVATVHSLSANEARFSTTSGSINLDEVELDKPFEFDTMSGSAKIGAMTASNAYFDTTSGDITIDKLNLTGEFHFDTTSGNAKINGIKASEARFNSTSGDFDVTLDSICDVEVDTISGETTVNVGKEGATAELSTTGGIILYGNERKKNGGKIVAGEGKSRINVSSNSGNLHINDKPGY